MIIHHPQLNSTDENSILSAQIEFKTTRFPFPEELWFMYPQEYADFMLLRGDAFLAGTLIPAMILGENIEVRTAVSPKLVRGLMEIQKIFKIWFPEKLTEVQIDCKKLEALPAGQTRGETASLFSGGVDSTFILQENIHPQQPIKDFQIQNSIMVQGADIPLNQPAHFRKLVSISKQALDPLGVNLIPCATNVRAFIEGLWKWDFTHGAAILSSGLVLSGLLKQLYIASSYNYRNLIPWGSSPLIDHWYSTESLDVVHVGASYRRTDKLHIVANWEPAYHFLRVCPSTQLKNQINCEACDKCLGTKAVLEMEGTLANFETFQRPFQYRDYLHWAKTCHPKTIIPNFVLRKVFIERRWKILPFSLFVVISRNIKNWLDRLLPDWLRTILRNRFFPLTDNPFYAKNIPNWQQISTKQQT